MHNLLILHKPQKNFCPNEGRVTYWLKQNIVPPNAVYLNVGNEQ